VLKIFVYATYVHPEISFGSQKVLLKSEGNNRWKLGDTETGYVKYRPSIPLLFSYYQKYAEWF